MLPVLPEMYGPVLCFILYGGSERMNNETITYHEHERKKIPDS